MVEPVACDPVVRPVDRDQAGRLPAHSHPLVAYPRLRKSNKCSCLRGAAVERMLTKPPDVRATTGTTVPTATAPALLLLQVPPIFPHIKQTS